MTKIKLHVLLQIESSAINVQKLLIPRRIDLFNFQIL